MDVVVIRDGKRYNLHFEKGENVGGLHEEAAPKSAHTGTSIRWKPDREVFMDTDIPAEYFADTVKRQAVVTPVLLSSFGMKRSLAALRRFGSSMSMD